VSEVGVPVAQLWSVVPVERDDLGAFVARAATCAPPSGGPGEGWFEVIAGKVVPDQEPVRCFSYVQT